MDNLQIAKKLFLVNYLLLGQKGLIDIILFENTKIRYTRAAKDFSVFLFAQNSCLSTLVCSCHAWKMTGVLFMKHERFTVRLSLRENMSQNENQAAVAILFSHNILYCKTYA